MLKIFFYSSETKALMLVKITLYKGLSYTYTPLYTQFHITIIRCNFYCNIKFVTLQCYPRVQLNSGPAKETVIRKCRLPGNKLELNCLVVLFV